MRTMGVGKLDVRTTHARASMTVFRRASQKTCPMQPDDAISLGASMNGCLALVVQAVELSGSAAKWLCAHAAHCEAAWPHSDGTVPVTAWLTTMVTGLVRLKEMIKRLRSEYFVARCTRNGSISCARVLAYYSPSTSCHVAPTTTGEWTQFCHCRCAGASTCGYWN